LFDSGEAVASAKRQSSVFSSHRKDKKEGIKNEKRVFMGVNHERTKNPKQNI
jgi:hypothetical protein